VLKLLKATNKTKKIFQQVKIRCALSKRDFTFEATDLGAGNSDGKSNYKKISKIVHRETLPFSAALIMSVWAKKKKAKKILELGTSLGLTTSVLAAITNAEITSIEGDPVLQRFARFTARKTGVEDKIHFILGDFDHYLEKLMQSTQFDIIFVDGNHTYQATMRYFRIISRLQPSGTIVIFDDINWSEGMRKAWKEIKNSSETKVIFNFVRTGIIKIIKK